MKVKTKLKTLAGATVAGAAAAYFLDPQEGARRREAVTRAVERRARDAQTLAHQAERIHEAVTPSGDDAAPGTDSESGASPMTNGRFVDQGAPAG
jgi:hypothetical protein